jgi:hypothetical protein
MECRCLFSQMLCDGNVVRVKGAGSNRRTRCSGHIVLVTLMVCYGFALIRCV